MSASIRTVGGLEWPRGADVSAAALWVVVAVPPSFGFWLVAGDLAGVAPGQQRTLLLASLFSLGLATLLQAVAGHRLAVFEGPASSYLAAIAVLGATSSGARPEAVTGGLLAAGLFVFALGVVGADRVLRRLFTPAVVTAFLLVIVLAVVPAALERAVGRTAQQPWGAAAAWASAAIVAGTWLAGRRLPRVGPYALVGSLAFGTLAYFLVDGFPSFHVGGGLAVPELLPWGAPELDVPIAAPFVVAGLLSAFNAVASVNVMGATVGRPSTASDERRGLLGHGATQLLTSCFGNLLGNVPRLDSVGVVRMIDNHRPQALVLAALAILLLAFVGPAIDVLALIPVAVSASLLTIVLAILGWEGVRHAARLDRRRRWLVVAPAVAPTVAWIFVGDDMSELAQFVANPLLLGVILAVVLDRALGDHRRQRPNQTGGPS